MVFSSISFIFILLPLFLTGEALLRLFHLAEKTVFNLPLRNAFLLAVSLLFYIWGEASDVLLLVFLGYINYYAGKFIYNNPQSHKAIYCFIGLNLAVLFGFKYAPWLISAIFPSLISKQPSLPLGISFFTFHAISYLLDIWRGQIRPSKNPVDFLTYFCMFPHLVAGPIVRYASVENDLARRGPHAALFSYGMYRFLLGLNKKVLIANSVSYIADAAFTLAAQGELHFLDAWIGITAYTIQIYFDFSGYSDMAIGLAAMAGFHFEENFRRPYSSASIREFWHRWHISLSSWLRDYLYIPLGGSRNGTLATYRNQLIVFFLCGLWHGADMTFIIWGLWHGLFLILERIKLGAWLTRLPAPLTRSYTMLVVMIGWVFFRADNMAVAETYLQILFTPSLEPVMLSYYAFSMCPMGIAILLCLVPDRVFPAPTSREPEQFTTKWYLIQVALAAISMAMLISSSRNPFIYFNF